MGNHIKLSFICLVLSAGLGLCCQSTEENKDWWETAQFYQIYPRSFKDSDGDGIGDLKGITEKLDYLKEIGVTATWLSPIYTSPMADFGYDIANFTEIEKMFGTMKDFEDLVKKAKSLGIKVILDFVPNHSSNESEWFKKSVAGEEGFEDFYVWHNGKVDEQNPENRLPPTNWLQAFRGSAWEWNDDRGQYYLHQFAVQQPDLNYRNQKVVDTMNDVLRFWLGKGVAGFRVDAVPWVFEIAPDEAGNYPDELPSGYTEDPEESAYLNHTYTQDQPETIELVYQWRKVLDDYKKTYGGDSRILMVETYSKLDYVMKFYGRKSINGAQLPFNFNFITRANNQSNAQGLSNAISLWLTQMPNGRVANWVMGNHDQRRVGSRYGEMRIDTMNMIALILPGASVTYMGEEIGMIDGKISFEDSQDPAACNSNEEIYEQFTRDPARTPFQWNNTTNAGFSSAEKTWLPVADSYQRINVQAQRTAAKSHLKVYKQMVQLRQTKTLKYGSVKYKAVNENVLVIVRQLTGEKSYAFVTNIGGIEENVDISKVAVLPTSLKYKIMSINSDRRAGATVSTNKINLKPYEAFVLESDV